MNMLDDFMEQSHPRWQVIFPWVLFVLMLASLCKEASMTNDLREKIQVYEEHNASLRALIEKEHENSVTACWRLANTYRVMENQAEPTLVSSAGGVFCWSKEDKHWVFVRLDKSLEFDWR